MESLRVSAPVVALFNSGSVLQDLEKDGGPLLRLDPLLRSEVLADELHEHQIVLMHILKYIFNGREDFRVLRDLTIHSLDIT